MRPLLTLLLSLFISAQALSWSNHTLVSHQLLNTLPSVRDAAPVKVESLESFLLATEKELEPFLEKQEQWMRTNLWYYAPRPDALMFKATGDATDIRTRFAKAIRVNPNTKWPLYLQLLPGEKRDAPAIDPQAISIFKDLGYLTDVQLIQLSEGDMVSVVDVVSAANDEPDHGLDIGLFTDSKTDYGKEYGFGEQPFGNPNLEYGTQAPFHMGFYHESPILYALGGFLKQTYPEYRIQLFKQLSEFAFQHGHDYWGWRFMGWGMHYIGDFSNPYHVMPVPGNSTLKTIWVGLLGMMGSPDAQNNAIQLASNRHTVLEDFQSLIMTKAYEESNHDHKTIQALNAPTEVRKYEDNHVIDVISKPAYIKANDIHDALETTMPEQYVNDVTVEYSELNAKANLEDTVRKESGEEGYNQLVDIIADLLSDFSGNGASYIEGIKEK